MSRQVVPSEIVSAYEGFLEAFREAVENADGKVSFPDKPLPSCFIDSGNSTTVAFKRCLHLENWPSRHLSRGKRLDVVILACEEITRGTWSLKRSTVYLNYFVISNSKARLVQSLHYDFLEGGQTDHPLFHVQLTNEPIAKQDRLTVGFDLELEPLEQSNECRLTTRIPTPDMTLASVLYCLVADHWADSKRTKIFIPFAKQVRSIQDRLPTLRFDTLKKSLQSSTKHFKSSHWFAHMWEQ
jgi:hypothetical protein